MKNARDCLKFWLRIFLLGAFVPSAAFASFSADTLIGYDIITIGHGNNNSVKPGDPSGFRLSESFTYRYGAFRNLRLFVESGLHVASWSANREASNIKVATRLNTIGLEFGSGVGAVFNDKWTGEVSLGGSYSPYSVLKYKAEVQGYVPIESSTTLGNLYQVLFGVKALWSFQKGIQLGAKVSSFTGGYGWNNPGTQTSQKDSFSSFGFAFLFRYWVGDEKQVAFDWSKPQKSKFSVKAKKMKPRPPKTALKKK